MVIEQASKHLQRLGQQHVYCITKACLGLIVAKGLPSRAQNEQACSVCVLNNQIPGNMNDTHAALLCRSHVRQIAPGAPHVRPASA